MATNVVRADYSLPWIDVAVTSDDSADGLVLVGTNFTTKKKSAYIYLALAKKKIESESPERRILSPRELSDREINFVANRLLELNSLGAKRSELDKKWTETILELYKAFPKVRGKEGKIREAIKVSHRAGKLSLSDVKFLREKFKA